MLKAHAPRTIVFGSLAMNQTLFFERLGSALEEQGLRIAYLCFHERSHEWLTQQGRCSYNAYALQPEEPDAIDIREYAIADPNLLLTHEKAAYEIYDTRALLRKLKGHVFAVTSVLNDLAKDTRQSVTLVQELGGFLSVLAAHYAARARGCDSYFIEPSFFRGRVFFSRNRLSAPEIRPSRSGHTSSEVRGYLKRVLEQQSVVIPAKDTHHYRKASSKLTDDRNIRRLLQKLWDKHVLHKREEFEHVGGHVKRHVRMFVNSYRSRPLYKQLDRAHEFIYYPLHVPADFALTIRAPEYLDQCALLDYLCRIAPATHRVAFKEHPALIGAVPHARVADLLKRHDNLVMLDPAINNYEVLKRAAAIVTVNSKSGAEALLLGKPVLALGDSFYRDCRYASRVDRLSDLPVAIMQAIEPRHPPDANGIEAYFEDVWDSSYPGELYELSAPNVETFARSLNAALAEPGH